MSLAWPHTVCSQSWAFCLLVLLLALYQQLYLLTCLHPPCSADFALAAVDPAAAEACCKAGIGKDVCIAGLGNADGTVLYVSPLGQFSYSGGPLQSPGNANSNKANRVYSMGPSAVWQAKGTAVHIVIASWSIYEWADEHYRSMVCAELHCLSK